MKTSKPRNKIEAYREMYEALAHELGSYYAANLIADTKPDTNSMAVVYAMFTERTGQVHGLDPMRAEKLGYKL